MSKDAPQLNLEPIGETPTANIATGKAEMFLDIGVAGVHPATAISTSPSITKDLSLDGYADERVAACIACFVDGFAAGWFPCASESFKDSLDIQMTQRVSGQGAQPVNTGQAFLIQQPRRCVLQFQGSNAPTELHMNRPPKLAYCVQVNTLTDVGKNKEYETRKCQFEYLRTKKETRKRSPKDAYNLKFARHQIDYGFD